MKRAMSVFGVLMFFALVILVGYSQNKVITRSSEWAIKKLEKLSENKYDVIVVGSDPEGIAAAIGSARSGAKTLLLGKEDGPGGLLTYGMLNTLDMSRSEESGLLTRGVFEEFYNAIGSTESFDVERAKKIFTELIEKEEKLEYRKSQKFVAPILEDKTIIGVKMEDIDGNRYDVWGKRIIDATQDGDVCASSGVPYYIGSEDINVTGNMAATLVIKVGGVKWKEIESDINQYRWKTGDKDTGFNKSTAWGFGKWCYDKYNPIHKNMQLRGPNFGLQDDGTILINALQIFDVDGLSEESKENAMKLGTEEAYNVVEHLRKILPSFKDAYLVGVADELYIRESRHIVGEYTLLATDVIGNRNFTDKIAMSSYPVDIQATSKSNTGYIIGKPVQYSIPLGCVIPKVIDNLFIVSKAASYSSVAAGSARVVPTGMAVGEASGIAAVYSITKDVTPRELLSKNNRSKIRELQDIFKNQNVYLNNKVYGDPNGQVEGYDKIKKLVNLGMLAGGYTNNFFLDREATVATLCNTMLNTLQRAGKDKYDLNTSGRIKKYYSTEPLTGGAATRLLAGFLEIYSEPKSVLRNPDWTDEEFEAKKQERIDKIEQESWLAVENAGYLFGDFEIDDVLTYKDVLILTVDVIEKYLGREIDIMNNIIS